MLSISDKLVKEFRDLLLLYQYYENLKFPDKKKREELAQEIRKIESVLATTDGTIEAWLTLMPLCDIAVEVRSKNVDDVMENYKWINIPDKVYQDIKNGVIMHTDRSWVLPTFYRFPSKFVGKKFQVGGNLNNDNEMYTLNFDISRKPDVFGHAENLPTLVTIPDSKFEIVEFDFLNPLILLQNDYVMSEYCRILKSKGSLIFKTCQDTDEYYCSNEAKEIIELLTKLFSIFGNLREPEYCSVDENFYYFEFIMLKD